MSIDSRSGGRDRRRHAVRRFAIWTAAGLAASQLASRSAQAQAVDFFFDSDGVTPVEAGSGIWDSSSPRWADSLTATTFTPWSTNFNNAIFNGPGGTIMVDTTAMPSSIAVAGGNYNFIYNPVGSSSDLNLFSQVVLNVPTGRKLGFLPATNGQGEVRITGGGTVDAYRAFQTNGGIIVVENGTFRFANGPVDLVNSTELALGPNGVLNMEIWNDGFGALSGSAGAVVRMGTLRNFGTVTGSQLTVGASQASTTFAGSLQGEGGQLFKAGAGTFTLSGANTFNGRVGIQGGTLRIENGQAIGDNSDIFFSADTFLDMGASERVGLLGSSATNAAVLGNGHTLTIGSNDTFNIQYNGRIEGAGTKLIKVGTGLQQFTTGGNASTYDGGTEIRGGALLVSGDLKLGAAGAPVTLDGGTLMNFNTVNLTHNRPFTVGTNGGGIQVNNNPAFASYTNNAQLTVTLPNTVSGPGRLTKTGGGRLALNNSGNTFGSLQLVEGQVFTNATSGTPFGTGSIVTQGGEIVVSPANVAGDLALTAASGTGGHLRYGPGTRLQLIRGSNTGTLTFTIGAPDAPVNPTDPNLASLQQGANGTLTIIPFGGVANLGNPASAQRENLIVTGGVPVKNGIVNPSIVSWTSGGSSAGEYLTYDMTNGFQLATYSSTDVTTAGPTDVVKHTSGPATLAADKTVYALNTNQTIDGAATLRIGDGTGPAGAILNVGANLNTTGGVVFDGVQASIYVQNTANVQVAGPLSVTGNNGLTKFGLGTLVLNSPATYTGPTVIGTGTLALGASNVLPATTDLRFGGFNSIDTGNTNAANARLTLRLNGNNQTVNSLASTNHLATVEIGTGGTFTVDQDADTTFLGRFTGGGTLVKTGTGTLRINPLDSNENSAGVFSSSYEKIKVSGGTVAFSSFTAMPALPAGTDPVPDMFTLENGGTLRWEGITNGVNSFFTTTQSSVTTVNNRRGVVLGEGGGVIDVVGPYEIFIWQFGANAAVGQIFSGTGGLTKTGPGFLRMNDGNTYTGPTKILGGVLQFANDGAFGPAPDEFVPDHFVIDNGAAIDSNGSGLFRPTRGITIGAGGAMLKSNNGPTLINSKISGPGAIIRQGGPAASQTNANSITLNAPNNTFNGITLVSGTTFFNGDGSAGVGPIDIPATGIVAFGKNEGLDSTLTNPINLGGGSAIDIRVTSDVSPVDQSIYNGTQTGTLTLAGKISGPGTLFKGLSPVDRYIPIIGGQVQPFIDRLANGTVILSNNTNDFSGDFTIMLGEVVAAANNALGATTGGTTVFDGGALSFANVNYSTPERLYISGTGHGSLGALRGSAGNSTFAGPVSIMKDVSIGAAENATLNLSGRVGGNATLTKVGPGRVILSGANNALPGNTVIQESTLEFASNHSIGRLQINPGTTAAVGGGDKVLKVRELAWSSFANPDAKLDLGAGRFALDYDELNPSPLQDVRAAIIAAKNTGWQGNGITSSLLTQPANANKAIGYGEASAVFGPGGGDWGGVPVDGTTVLARYTILGDADLSGNVAFPDLVALAQNYNNNTGTAVWTQGDFTYDGNVDFGDLVALAQNYNQSLPAAGSFPASFEQELAAAFAQVPEPGALALLAMGGAALAGRRRRRRG